jgi:hypothetical protein
MIKVRCLPGVAIPTAENIGIVIVSARREHTVIVPSPVCDIQFEAKSGVVS